MTLTTSSAVVSDLMERLATIRLAIEHAAARTDRDPSGITLVGVSKTVDRAMIDAAYDAGLRQFGENRVQDAAAKFGASFPADARAHLIGQLQSNKAKTAVRIFDVIESVDRPSLVAALVAATAGLERPIPVLLQVNIAREPQKTGCAPEDAAALVGSIRACSGLDLRGLMTIAPLADDIETVRPVFAGLRTLRDDLRHRHPGLSLSVLSMGMSNDFGVAIEEGATHVRIGRALFHG